MSLLEIANLSLDIGGDAILRDVSLTVAPGEIVGIIGESGSGKSMTAFSVMQLLPRGAASHGRITLGEIDVIGASEATMCGLRGNEVGMVFQEPMTALNPVRTIGDQVAETVMIHDGSSRDDALRIAREVLDRVGLPECQFPLTRYPHELSGGQRQRVVIAMAIALRPQLLIADEPTTALDVTTQAQILELLSGLVDDYGMGLLFITHDLAVVSGLADRIVVMRRGEVVEQGPTAQVMAEMRHPYTRMLFEASSHRVTLPPHPATRAPLLQVRNVSRDYPLPRRKLLEPQQHFRAVRDVSFTLEQGDRVGLVGESGCGKSTLTRAILGLEDVQSGEILLDGAPVWSGHRPNLAVRRKIQVVFQDPYGSFNPRWRVGPLVAEPLHLLETPPEGAALKSRIGAVLESVGLSAADAGKYIHEFSGGQRQRIAIARALITRPELVVFDEAVSALDVSVRAQILDLMADLAAREGLSYLFISHDLSVVRTVTDRVMVMQAGRIVEEGPTEQVFAAPDHPYTRTLIDAAPRLPRTGAA